jgi:hypothetical protein
MRTDPLPRLLVVGLTILSVSGCSAAAAPSPTPSAGSAVSPASSLPPASMPAGPRSGASSAAPDDAGAPPAAWLLVGRPGQSNLHLVMATTGEVEQLAVPDGAPSIDWQRVVTASVDGSTTVVRDTIVQPGYGGPQLQIDGHWRLPTVGLDPIPAGRSLDGSTVALVEGKYDPSGGRSRFAIVEHRFLDQVTTSGDADLRLVRIVDLPGAFEFDTLSPNGRILYVVQHLDGDAGGHYQVRAVDVATGVMRDGVIVDKTHPDETMAGSPIAQVRRPNGFVLTLYRGPEHPFIHALSSSDAWAICIDLPKGGSTVDAAASLDWGLASGLDLASVFAVNASLGLAVEIDANDLSVRRSASIGSTAAAPIVLAKFGHGEVGPVGRRLIPSPDGTLLFAAGAHGLTVIKTADLAVVRTDLAGSSIDALGITPDGTTLFALLRDGGRIVALDAATGRQLGTVPGEGYDRLLAVAPW